VIQGLSHIGIAVADLDEAIRLYRDVLGLTLVSRWVAEEDRIEAASFRAGDVEIELMRPLDDGSPVAKFLAKRGEGIHHLAFAVEDAAAALERARAGGLETIDEEPRTGGGGRTRVGFLHPRTMHGVLTELEQEVHGDD
jgi:methylmalonyl-CoA/ethylmalonyl-CoA epimerase